MLLDAKRWQAGAMAVRLRQEIEANTDDVGGRFPEVARAIHAGDEPERPDLAAKRASMKRAR